MHSQESLEAKRTRQPHAILDEASRMLKARKIVELLGEREFLRARRILEIGCGSGVIASTLSELGGEQLEVFGIDVVDNRVTDKGFRFLAVTGTTLPFDPGTFDIVITNHVIEHVGDASDQLHHLQEIRRVLASSGSVYLAVPNKWRLVEPHYRLPLLSWFPQALSDRYVRLTGRGTHYDCLPLDYRGAMSFFRESGFHAQNLTIDAIYSTLRIEFPDSRIVLALRRFVPRWAFHILMPIIPTIIFGLKKGHV